MINKGIAAKLRLNNMINYLFEPSSRREAKQRRIKNKVEKRDKKKVFVIGFNKTGTTSLETFLKEEGYILGIQGLASKLILDVVKDDTQPLIEFTKTAEAFQDIPFSLPDVYKELFKVYPNAKYILSVRDTPEDWFNSIVRFHSKVWGDGRKTTREDIQRIQNNGDGYPETWLNNYFDGTLYEKDVFCQKYKKHIEDVRHFFRGKLSNFIEINLKSKGDYERLCTFLEIIPYKKTNGFPWENKTA